jgi:DNA-directed RNA polymerase specialized sigma24 family protein
MGFVSPPATFTVLTTPAKLPRLSALAGAFMSTTDLRPVPTPQFQDTHWSLILKAARNDEESATALNKLCRGYWVPLYGYVRRRGINPSDAEDLVQGFFADFIQRAALQKADQSRGRFRWFLLGCLKNFLNNEWDRLRTLKRGGEFRFVSFDAPTAEAMYGDLAALQLTPETLFDRAWAQSFVEQVLGELREEYRAEGRLATFETLESVLSKYGRAISFADAARQLASTEVAVRMAAMRLRRRYGELLYRQILKIVANPAEADDELRYLLRCLDNSE